MMARVATNLENTNLPHPLSAVTQGSVEGRVVSLLEALNHYLPLQEQIEDFWLEPDNRESASWQDHADINMVMLATSLEPEGYLDL